MEKENKSVTIAPKDVTIHIFTLYMDTKCDEAMTPFDEVYYIVTRNYIKPTGLDY